MKKTITILLSALPFLAYAQADIHEYKARKYVLINYGERLESESPGMTRIILNLRDSSIAVHTPSAEARNFLQGKTIFHYRYITEEHRGARLFFCEDFVISISAVMRRVIIGVYDLNPNMHSLMFYELK